MIDKFVDTYNNYIKSKNKYFNKIDLNHDTIKKKSSNNNLIIIQSLIENYIVSEGSLFPEFMLFDELLQNSEHEDWIAFAEFYGHDMYYTYSIKTGKVFLVETNTNFIRYNCGSSQEKFLEAMTIVLEIETLRFNNNCKEIDDSILLEKYNECVKIAEVEKDNFFYTMLLGVDTEMLN
jgi:hypothetical protein